MAIEAIARIVATQKRDAWTFCEFGQLYAEPSRNGLYKPAALRGFGTRIVNMGEIFACDTISNQDMSRVHVTSRELATSGLKDGDLIFGRRSIVASGAGKCSLIVSPAEPMTFESSIIRVRLNRSKALPAFYYYFFQSPIGRSIMSDIVSGTNVKGIRGSDLKTLSVPVPSLDEQRTIAEVLMNADARVTLLEQVIAKKRDILQGAAQQLLTGKRRLPGFSSEWKVKILSELVDVLPSGVYGSGKPSDGSMPARVATTAHITDDDEWNGKPMTVRYFSPEQIARYIVRKNDLVVVKSSGSAANIKSGKIGLVTNSEEEQFVFSNFMMVLRPVTVEPKFLYYCLTSSAVKSLLPSLVEASTYPNLRLDEYLGLEIPIPSPDEQNAIALLLSNMRAELGVLEAKAEKARDIKQGMMQELLTGRVRLV